MKYIIARRPHDVETPFLLTAPHSHADLAFWLRPAGFEVVSAGFVRFHGDGSVTTHGDSCSLVLAPRPQDADLIAAHHRAALAMVGVEVPKPEAPYARPPFHFQG